MPNIFLFHHNLETMHHVLCSCCKDVVISEGIFNLVLCSKKCTKITSLNFSIINHLKKNPIDFLKQFKEYISQIKNTQKKLLVKRQFSIIQKVSVKGSESIHLFEDETKLSSPSEITPSLMNDPYFLHNKYIKFKNNSILPIFYNSCS